MKQYGQQQTVKIYGLQHLKYTVVKDLDIYFTCDSLGLWTILQVDMHEILLYGNQLPNNQYEY